MSNFKISELDVGKRLDVFVSDKLPSLSRASTQKIIKAGEVVVNGQAEKLGYKLRHGDIIKIDHIVEQNHKVPDIEIPVIYEDSDCLVIDKPAGLLTHSKGAFNPESTVASFVAQHTKLFDNERTGIVHRLDRATSGVMICAKTPESLSWLQKQFSQRKVKKTYIAMIEGELNPSEAIIDMPIERNPQKPQTFRVGTNGKQATTHYVTKATNGKVSIVELKPVTGRTHQLRVHMKHLGHPIIGDTLYGGSLAERLFLHALILEITLPNRTRIKFGSPLPSSFSIDGVK